MTQAMGGALAHLDLALLHHTGRRSGKSYVVPVSYMSDKDAYLMVGSFAGAATEPQWVANVESATEVTVEIGTRTVALRPTVRRGGPQRDTLYQAAREHWPFLLDYEKKTSRPFPVIRLAPINRGRGLWTCGPRGAVQRQRSRGIVRYDACPWPKDQSSR